LAFELGDALVFAEHPAAVSKATTIAVAANALAI